MNEPHQPDDPSIDPSAADPSLPDGGLDDGLGRELAGMLARRADAMARPPSSADEIVMGHDRVRGDAIRPLAPRRDRRAGYLAAVAAAVLLVAGGVALLGADGLTSPAVESEPVEPEATDDGDPAISTSATILPSSTFDTSNGATFSTTTMVPPTTGTIVPTTEGPDDDLDGCIGVGTGGNLCCTTGSTTWCSTTTSGPPDDPGPTGPVTTGTGPSGTGTTGPPTTGTTPPSTGTQPPPTPTSGTQPSTETTGGSSPVTTPSSTVTTTPDPEDCQAVTTVPGCP